VAVKVRVGRVFNQLNRLEPKLKAKIGRKAARKVAKETVYKTAREKVPVKSGDLKKSIKVRALKRSRKNKHKVGARVVTGPGFFKGEQYYGGFVEYGTRRMAAQPFMRPAAIENRKRVPRMLRAEIKKLLRAL
jgi:HK97 gp10 family phage protein